VTLSILKLNKKLRRYFNNNKKNQNKCIIPILRGDWVQLQQGTIATKIKKGVKYFLVVLKKSPFEHHMGKQLCVKFG